jgi:transcriptional regulator with XRE-family HTH domain
MGHSRPRPKHLAKKLLQIRRSLGVSQGEHTTISKYELNKNEPPLAILLAYARLAGIPVEQIIDDETRTNNLILQDCPDRFHLSTR